MSSERDHAVILFDGVCNLCNGWVRFILARDKHNRFRFAALQSQAGQRLLTSMGYPSDFQSSIILIHTGVVFTESDAILEILRIISGIWGAVVILRIIPKALRDLIYRWIAARRYKLFGKTESCMLPTEAQKKHFLQ